VYARELSDNTHIAYDCMQGDSRLNIEKGYKQEAIRKADWEWYVFIAPGLVDMQVLGWH
jgi:hypothetical protein